MPSRKGSQNKNRQALIILLQDKYPDYNPVVEMAHIAMDSDNDVTIRFNAHKEIAGYTHTKNRSIVIEADIDVTDAGKILDIELESIIENDNS